MHSLISIERVHSGSPKEVREPYYFIFTFEGKASFTIDFTDYECNGRNLLFLSPYQFLQWRMVPSPVDQIQFHGDFYCIEYHKKEVACNGILFNNIYQQPYVPVSKQLFGEIGNILGKMRQLDLRDQENAPVLRSYRSEEHTSELQSLMRISYAVFCLKKKN